jgi:hypothetical protein
MAGLFVSGAKSSSANDNPRALAAITFKLCPTKAYHPIADGKLAARRFDGRDAPRPRQ